MHKIKKLLKFIRIKQLVKRDWKRRFAKVFKAHPEYKKPIDKNLIKPYCDYWKQLGIPVNIDTLTLCYNISGCHDIRMIPEEVFHSIIDDTLNPDHLLRFFAHKSFYERWHPEGIFPKTYLHNISGIIFDQDFQVLDNDQIPGYLKGIPYPAVIKPNRDTSGGKNVYFAHTPDEAIALIKDNKDFVLQEMITQHNFFSKYNDKGINTLRVVMFRAFDTNKYQYLNAALRMGQGGSLDNETDGGIVCYINDEGRLHDYAFDKSASKYYEHPDTKLVFAEDTPIPDFDGLKKVATLVANNVYLGRLMSLDMVLDSDGNWRMIEIGLRGHATRFSQYAGVPYFGKYTDEVIEYCKNNFWYKN